MQLDAVFAPALIDLNLQAATKDEAITVLASMLDREGALLDRRSYIGAVEAREAQISTSVGLGVAIPHGKSPAVRRPAVALGRTAGIDWNGDPVQLIFLLAVPEQGAGTDHLEILAALAQLLLDESFRGALLEAATTGEAFGIISRYLTHEDPVSTSDQP